MTRGLEDIVFPPLEALRGPALPAVVEALRACERASAIEIEDGKRRQLDVLMRRHARTTPHFKKRLAHAGSAPEDDATEMFARLSPITRRDVQDAGEDFSAADVPASHKPLGRIITSGSTGEPVRLTKTRVNRLVWAANTIRDHAWNGRRFAGRMSIIRPGITEYLEQDDWGPPASELHRTGAAQAIPVITPIDVQARLLADFQPSVLLVYPNNLGGLCDHWETAGFDLKDLRHIRTISETVGDRLRDRVKRLCGLTIEDCYSSQEAGMIALQCPEGGAYHVSEALHVEILDASGSPCAPGECGRVVVTDLHNFASPLIRYDIGDHAVAGGSCVCGRPTITLRRIMGRDRNLLIRPDGSRHWPLSGFHDFDSVAPIRQYQLVQKTRSSIELRLVTDAPLDDVEAAAFADIVRKVLEFPFDVSVVQSRERLPLTGSGKFEEFVCEAE